jgi:DNA-binding XRE family transcriptional regulator
MTDFGAIDALLARAKKEVPLPPAEERRHLRDELNLSRAQLAQALGVSSSTVAGWKAEATRAARPARSTPTSSKEHGPSWRPGWPRTPQPTSLTSPTT